MFALAALLLFLSLVTGGIYWRRRKDGFFVRGLSEQQKQALSTAGVPFKITSLENPGTPGALILRKHLNRACRTLNSYVFETWRTKRARIHETILRPKAAANADVGDARIYFVNGTRRNVQPDRLTRKRVSALLQEVILPAVGCDVVVHTMRGAVVQPINDNRFHVFVHSSPVVSRTSHVPPSVFGVRFDRAARQALIPPPGTPGQINDGAGYAPAEIAGTNCLYLHHNALASSGPKLAQLAAILDACVPHLTIATGVDEVLRELGAPRPTLNTRITFRSAEARIRKVMSALIQATIAANIDSEIVVENCFGQQVRAVEDGKFHIHYNARPEGANPGAAIPTGSGMLIILGDTEVVAELQERNLYLFSDVLNVCTRNEVQKLSRILTQVAEELRIRDEAVAVTDGFISEAARAVESATLPAATDAEQEFTRTEQRVQQLTRSARGSEIELMHTEMAEAELGREFDRILNLRKVRSVEVTGSAFVVRTDTMYCRDPRTGYIHLIGDFEIHLYYNGTVQFFNQTNARRFQAPHVNEAGNPCLGTIRQQMPDLLRDRQLESAVVVAIAFLESVNVDDAWGRQISNWPVAHGRTTV